MDVLRFAWLEITGKCPLQCEHCYADSGPHGTHGTMSSHDWYRILEQIVELGGRVVQFIGGEPTLHPALPALIGRALALGVNVEVFSNLAHVTAPLWDTFAQSGVSLATSYYSDTGIEHDSITGGRGSYPRTRANIAEAVRRSIPLRVGLIDVRDGQRVGQAHAELTSLGVTNIAVDRLRQVGRGAGRGTPDTTQLCGQCGRGTIAIGTGGDVWPCVFARWMRVGNVHESTLSEILASPVMAATRGELRQALGSKQKCNPETQCAPAKSNCQPHCPPGYHSDPKKCWPYYYPDDK